MTRLPTLGPRGEGWVAVQLILVAAVVGAGAFLGPDWAGVVRFVGILAGLMMLAGGMIIAVRGAVDLRHALTPLPRPNSDATLMTAGIYGLARHPIYGGLILGSLGWSVMQASLAALVLSAALAGFLTLKSAREEAWLVERFPDYAAYRVRTRRFIPWIG